MQTNQPQRWFLAATVALTALGLLAALSRLPLVLVLGTNVCALSAAIAAWFATKETNEQPDLIAEVSHELRTPLTGILGTLELLTDSTIPLEPSEVDELMIAAHGEANHLLHIVSNLHARSRLDRAVLTPASVDTNLRSIVGKAMARNPAVASRTHLSPGDQAVAIGDPQLIMQVVTNLVQNIDRYAAEGDVRIGFKRTGDVMTVSFTDSGAGVPLHRSQRIFEATASTEGLGLGLSLSRQLARAMGGDLTLDNPGEMGAVFTLSLPASDELLPADPSQDIFADDRIQAHSPRARLLVDLAEAMSGASLSQVVGGISKIYRDLLGATGAVLYVPRRDGSFHSAGPYLDKDSDAVTDSGELADVVASGRRLLIDDVATSAWATEEMLGGTAAMLLPVHDGEVVGAVLAVGWKTSEQLPSGSAVSVAEALAEMTSSSIARTALTRDIVFERRLRSSVLDELPIAVSVFAGDPLEVIDWNRKERQMLGIDDDAMRPTDLGASQDLFRVRFADGTPLTVENAPVTTAMQTGEAAGPFILVIRRMDGSQIHSRTYCAPFKDDQGKVVGAVVTSEPMDFAVSPNL